MVSFLASDPQTVHKRRGADGALSSQPQTARHRKQKLTPRFSDSGFEGELLSSPAQVPNQIKVCPLRIEDTETHSGHLSSWYLQYGVTGYKIQKEREAHFHPSRSLAQQPQLNAEARCKLVSWLIPVHKHLGLSFECCCLTVNIMDRFLESTPVAADCFQLLGVTALLLACKQVEVCSPTISHLLSLCCDAFTKEQLCNLECLILVRLNFRLSAPTLAFFLECYTNLTTMAPSGTAVRTQIKSTDEIKSKHCGKLAQKLCELSLADYVFNKYPQSLIAKCALQLASEIQQASQGTEEDQWDSFMESVCVHSSTDSTIYTSNSFLSAASLWKSTDSLEKECKNSLSLLASLNLEALKML